MSLSGHLFSTRGKRRSPDSLSEQLARTKSTYRRISQSIETDIRAPGDLAENFHSQQSLLKKSLADKPRLDLARNSLAKPQGIRSSSRIHSQSSSQTETSSQDSPPTSLRHRTNISIRSGFNKDSHLDADQILGHEHEKSGVVVIHQRAFFRDCFVRCLEVSYQSHDIFAFASASDWQNSTERNALSPSVIVFFVDSASSNSIADLQFVESVAAERPVVIVSDVDDVNYVVRALKGGARGYIPTSLPFNVAVEAVRLVEAGGTFVPASSLELERNHLTESKTSEILTERQLMVVEALCRGMANKQIAYQLSMSEHTVKVHLRHIMRKLNAKNRTEVAVLTKDLF